jgi:hypothetical protein
VPYSTCHVVGAPLASTVPGTVAEVNAMAVAAPVVAIGGSGLVVCADAGAATPATTMRTTRTR